VKVPFIRNLLIRIRGGEPLPAGVVLPVEKRERVLTWGRVGGGGIAAATDVGLRVQPGDGDPVLHRWHEIANASWADGRLDVERMDGSSAAYRLTEPRGVPAAVREHITASVVVSERHQLESGVGFRVVARRDLFRVALHWSAVLDRALDADDPALRSQVNTVVDAVRRRHGG